MVRQQRNKLGLIAAVGLMGLTLSASPARADHGSDIVVPVVAAFALGAFWNHGHSDHHYRHSYRYKRYGYSRHGYSRKGHSRKSYSRKGHYGNGHVRYWQPPQHSSSRGGYYGSKRKHYKH